MPISWKGTLAQYAGRLHRDYADKQEVLIYDYVDLHIPMLERMYQKRLAGYSSIGYNIRAEISNVSDDIAKKNRIFTQEDYSATFSYDVKHTRRTMTIVSPYLQMQQVKHFLSWLPQKVKVQVITSDSTHFKPETEEKVKVAIASLEAHNVQVHRVPRQCQRCAIFDEEILWYGGINFLGYEHYDNGSMRLFSAELAKELLSTFETL